MAGKKILEKGVSSRKRSGGCRGNRPLSKSQVDWIAKTLQEIFPQELFNEFDDYIWFHEEVNRILGRHDIKKVRIMIMYFYRMKYREIAKIYKCSAVYVGVVVRTIREEFRKALKLLNK